MEQLYCAYTFVRCTTSTVNECRLYFAKQSLGIHQGCKNCGILAAGLRENRERMRKWRKNGERMRKWREIHSLHFLIFSLSPPPPLSISYIKNCLILSWNVKYGPFVANVVKNLASLLNENEIIQALELFTPLVYMKRKDYYCCVKTQCSLCTF